MDPLCHTLVGAALGEAGLKRRTRLAMPTLVVGANLPDVDVAAYFWGNLASLGFRRGWTHGVLALVVLPLVLTALIVGWDRWRSRPGPGEAAIPGQVLLLAGVAIASHPVLDFLNTYGMRWLMPFRDVWFYGDTLFIADPWIWLALATGVFVSLRRGRRGPGADTGRPARIALAGVLGYILAMGVMGVTARAEVRQQLARQGIAVERLMVAPVAANALVRDVLVESGGAYARTRFRWPPGGALEGSPARGVPINADHPAARAAAATAEGRAFLHWARFPYFRVQELPTGYLVRMVDARYDAGWASIVVDIPRPLTGWGP